MLHPLEVVRTRMQCTFLKKNILFIYFKGNLTGNIKKCTVLQNLFTKPWEAT